MAKKLEKTAQKIRKEGWKWVQTVASYDYEEWSDYERCEAEPVPMSQEEQKEFDALEAEASSLAEAEANHELDEDQQARSEAISERLEELEDRPEIWPPETLAIAGVVVGIGPDGEPDIRYGFVKPEDMPETEPDDGTAEDAPAGRPALPYSLVEDLTAQRSAALNAALTGRPDVALAAVVHTLALQVFGDMGYNEGTALQISADVQRLDPVEGSRASNVIKKAEEDSFPGDPEVLFAWCLAQPQETLLKVLAYCVAQTIDAVQKKSDHPNCSRLHYAALLADALQLDMNAWFTPTAANYFSRVSKAKLLECLREVKGSIAPAWEKMKKSDLAALAERELSGKGWLPAPLRAPRIISEEPLAEAA